MIGRGAAADQVVVDPVRPTVLHVSAAREAAGVVFQADGDITGGGPGVWLKGADGA